ncbi:MAG: DUF2029 domain-containing protein [Anaerolineae bacterium]|nr:DUF2029 domain-containing protein [Anaerolineae bacterium]
MRNPRARSWLIIVVGVVLITIGVLAIFRYVQGAIHIHTDLANDYGAAQALRAGQSIYAERNNHPPLAAFFFLPLSFLPYGPALVVWTGLSLLLYVLVIGTVGRTLDIHVPQSWVILLCGLALIWYPFLAHIALGQFSLVLAACLILGWRALRRGRAGWAGVLFGVATALKLFPGLVAVTLLARRRWRALGVMIITTLFGLLLPLAFIPAGDFIRYFGEVAPQNAAQYAVFPVNHAISGVISRLFVSGPWIMPIVDAPWLASVLIAGLSLLVVGLLAWSAWRLPETPQGIDVAWSLTCVAMLLVSPITWQHAFTVLILPLGVLLRVWLDSPTSNLRKLGLLVFTLLALPDVELARALMALSLPERMPWWQSFLPAAGAAALVLLWLLLVRHSDLTKTTQVAS